MREPAFRRIDVDGGEQHVGAIPEDLLRPVALVCVDIDDRDAFEARVCGSKACAAAAALLEVAGAPEEGRPGVVTRRPDRGGGLGTRRDEVCRALPSGRPRRPRRTCPRSEGHRVHGVQAQLGPDRRGSPAPVAGREPGVREQVARDIGLPGALQVTLGDPGG